MTGIRTLGYLTLDAGPIETIDAAAAAGFKSVGIRITGRRIADPYAQVLGNPSAIDAIRTRIADTGIALSNVSAYHMYPDVTVDHLRRVMEAVVELGAGIFVSNSYEPDEASYVDRLAQLCEFGAAAGVRVAVEFMRYSAVRTLADAQRVVRAAGAPNLGLLIDPLHLARAGGTVDDVRAIDPAQIVFAQLCDAKPVAGTPSDDALRHEARNGRLYPGDGCLPLREFLAALPPGTEIEYEVPRQDTRRLTVAERARVAWSVFETFLDAQPASR